MRPQSDDIEIDILLKQIENYIKEFEQQYKQEEL